MYGNIWGGGNIYVRKRNHKAQRMSFTKDIYASKMEGISCDGGTDPRVRST